MELKPDMVVVNSDDFEEFLASRGDINTADQVGAVPLYDGRLVQFLITDAVAKGTTTYRQGRKWYKVKAAEVAIAATPGSGSDVDSTPVGTPPEGIDKTTTLPDVVGTDQVNTLPVPEDAGQGGPSSSTHIG